MAATLGLSYQAISKWENAAAFPDIQMIPKIAEYFADCIRENRLEFDTLVGLAYSARW